MSDYTRQQLIATVTDVINNLLNHYEGLIDVVDGNALMETLPDDEKGIHLRLTVDWWVRNKTDDDEAQP